MYDFNIAVLNTAIFYVYVRLWQWHANWLTFCMSPFLWKFGYGFAKERFSIKSVAEFC